MWIPESANDHGSLDGLADDDHTQYVLADGSRPFTNPVSGVTPTDDAHLATKAYVDSNSGGGGGEQVLPFHRSGDLEVTPGTLPFPAPFNMAILGVRAAVGTPPTGDDAIVDVNKNGTTIFTTQGNRPTISDGNTTSEESTPDVSVVDEGDLLTVDIDQIGSSTPGADLVVAIRFSSAV